MLNRAAMAGTVVVFALCLVLMMPSTAQGSQIDDFPLLKLADDVRSRAFCALASAASHIPVCKLTLAVSIECSVCDNAGVLLRRAERGERRFRCGHTQGVPCCRVDLSPRFVQYAVTASHYAHIAYGPASIYTWLIITVLTETCDAEMSYSR